jgi:glycosyltransferase involved in cell wall biosynthesis
LFFFEQIVLPIILILKGFPYLLCLNNTFPLIYVNSVVVVHDVAALRGDWFKPIRYKLYFKFILPIFLRFQKYVFTVSEFSKNEIIEAYGINKNKIIVLGNGPSFKVNRKEQIIKLEHSRKKPYLITIGSIDPRKNLKSLIEAFHKSQASNTHDLIIVGSENKIFKNVNLLESSKRNIIYTGYLDKKIMIEYLRMADLFISVSLYEGFGIPVLEAITLNKNILISNIETYREIYEGCGYFTDNLNTIEIAENIDLALKNRITKEMELKRKLLMETYTWRNLTIKMLNHL